MDAFTKIGGFNANLATCEDYDLSFRLKPFGRLLSDSRIVAIHHREPATLKEFFNKESWRGKSNYDGLKEHGFHWKELPSLLLPVVHLFFFLVSCFLILMLSLGVTFVSFSSVVAWLLFWQLPIFALAFYKASEVSGISLKLGLYVLLNIYFFARARAMFRSQ